MLNEIGWKTGSWACIAVLLAATAPASADADGPRLSFNRDVVPVLTKAGCNSGACHGSFQGRGGFRLSLLGFDPAADFEALVNEGRGRRVFPAAPESSLILLKPTGAISHGGGKRLSPESPAYGILQRWIREGMPRPELADFRVTRLVVQPSETLLQPGQEVALRVQAIWSDGQTQDATAWSLYDTTSDAVASVTSAGQVKVHGPGRGAITVRYQGQVAAVPITAPYAQAESLEWQGRSFIDDQLAAEWRKLGLRPAPLASDAEFFRRVHLDLIGTLPTPAEVRSFLANQDPSKRAKLIDQLLERPEYVDFWALKWGDLLRAHRRSLGDKGLASFSTWLRQALRENRPIDRMVRELLTARGNLYTNGPVAFYFVDQNPSELAETTAQVFLGIRLTCARCHHHPFEVWSQDDYHGLAAFFARVQRKDTREGGSFGGAQSISLGPEPAPGANPNIAPRFPGMPPEPNVNAADPRETLARWITADNNPYFAVNVVNRYWGYLFGRGLVEPIDDLRATNPAAHPVLLRDLAQDFSRHRYDLKHLLRTLCNSRVYQLASDQAAKQDVDGMFCTHHRPRRLPAEVLLDAMNQAAGTVERFEPVRAAFTSGAVPLGTRAIALLDPTMPSYFLDVFGRPKRTNTCECDRQERTNLAQVLHLVNSDAIHQKVADPKGRVAQLLGSKLTDAEIIDELYLATMSRPVSAAERDDVLKLIAAAPSRKEGVEDLLWALLNSPEFLFRH